MTIRKYFYFAHKGPGVVPVFDCVSEGDPTAEQIDAIYHELVRAQGLGVPRPTLVGWIDLVPVPESEGAGGDTAIIVGDTDPDRDGRARRPRWTHRERPPVGTIPPRSPDRSGADREVN